MKAAVMNDAVMKNYAAAVPVSEIEAHTSVKRARAAVEQATRAHADLAGSLAKFDGLLPRIEETERRAKSELEALRQQLVGISAAILVGDATEEQEALVLAAIADADRVVRRCELGRPVVEERIKNARKSLEPRARAIESADEEPDRVRARVRQDLAVKAL